PRPPRLVAPAEQAVAHARARRQRDLALRRAPAGEHGGRQRRCSQALRHAQPPGPGGLGVVVLVVVGVVVVGVVVVGVVCVFEASTPTESFTSEPLRTRRPEAGLCVSTSPTWDSCSVFCCTALGVTPALRDSPRRSGTRTGAGPLETFTSTTLPACSSVPAGGSVPITRPALIVGLGCELVLGMKPAAFSRARACVADSPSTEGSAAMPGPVEITILTCPPCSSLRPARADWLDTSPLGTV